MGGQERQGGGREKRERERKARGIVYGGKAATTARGHLPTTSETLQPPSATTSILWSSLAPHPPSAWPGLGWAGQHGHREERHATPGPAPSFATELRVIRQSTLCNPVGGNS